MINRNIDVIEIMIKTIINIMFYVLIKIVIKLLIQVIINHDDVKFMKQKKKQYFVVINFELDYEKYHFMFSFHL